ncbi:MAG TPA: glutamate-5-semialdehyde dehydrogenase [Erysipelotrichaceae bacterium]|nr:glutamate-5-semialdehyde dehydrogenase [Erysipelotrichaceae bacterium]
MNAQLEKQLKAAKMAAREMMTLDTTDKNDALEAISDALLEHQQDILTANAIDLKNAKENGITDAMYDRLTLDEKRIAALSASVKSLISLDDPVGEVIREIDRPNGLKIVQVRVPMGVYGIIYEARPNVTVDIAALCLKSGNCCVLKGGKEAIMTNKALMDIMLEAIAGIIPEGVLSLIENNDHEIVNELIHANDYLDVVVPRGGAGLIQFVVKNATVPVIETGAGICHLYVDKDADLSMALEIAKNAKLQRPSVCNAIETILIHKNVYEEFLPPLREAFSKVKIYGDERTCEVIKAEEAIERNYATEYDDYIVNIKIVDDVNEAIDHIYKYSTKHSESIITNNQATADLFMNALDSACVYHNASTRFSDGGEFGFGAELGISTQKLHARGPLGLREMCSFKYKIEGNGQIRE